MNKAIKRVLIVLSLIAITTIYCFMNCKCESNNIKMKFWVHYNGYWAHSDMIFLSAKDSIVNDIIYIEGKPICRLISCSETRLEIEELAGKKERGTYRNSIAE